MFFRGLKTKELWDWTLIMGKRKEKEQNLFYEPMDDAERFQHKEKGNQFIIAIY